jgi:hypothetical protein
MKIDIDYEASKAVKRINRIIEGKGYKVKKTRSEQDIIAKGLFWVMNAETMGTVATHVDVFSLERSLMWGDWPWPWPESMAAQG